MSTFRNHILSNLTFTKTQAKIYTNLIMPRQAQNKEPTLVNLMQHFTYV